MIKMDQTPVVQNINKQDQKSIACVQSYFEEETAFVDFAEPSATQVTYEKLKDLQEQNEIERKSIEIEDYKKFKLEQIQSDSIQLIDTDEYQDKVNKIFNEMEQALNDLKSQQERSQYIQVSRIFSSEIVLQICGSQSESKDCSTSECQSFEGTYQIYEDAKLQLITIESPISGPIAFEYNQKRNQWISLNQEVFIQGFLSGELLKKTDGFLNM